LIGKQQAEKYKAGEIRRFERRPFDGKLNLTVPDKAIKDLRSKGRISLFSFQVVADPYQRQLVIISTIVYISAQTVIEEHYLHWTTMFVIYFSVSSDTNHDSLLKNTTYTVDHHV
jgi:hypothetical protein